MKRSISPVAPPHQSNLDRRRGVSFLEVLVVLGITTLLAVIAVPGTTSALHSYHLSSAVRRVSGVIPSSICNIGVTTRSVYSDRRFTQRASFAPPWFPSTTITQGGALSTNFIPTIQRVQWLNQTSVN